MALLQALLQEEEEGEMCKISPWGVKLKGGRPESGIWNLAAWKAGLFEVQDEGSQLIALATEAVPGACVHLSVNHRDEVGRHVRILVCLSGKRTVVNSQHLLLTR